MSTLATILEIQRMSTEDGPGIRTTVFFKGCSLACTWCHNPESIESDPEVVWHKFRCIGCRSCVVACPEGARSLSAEGALVDRSLCRDCGQCIDACPASAIERQGRIFSLEDIVDEVVKDRVYYEASGGGVTLSGGEPALQPAFSKALLNRCRSIGLHTALDTSGMCSWKQLEALAKVTDLVLYDVKEINSKRHKAHTKHGNSTILKNLRRLVQAMREGSITAKLWIRTPLIPGATATAENLESIGELLASELAEQVERWDLCAFNNLCRDKYDRLGKTWDFQATELLSEAALEDLVIVARRSGLPQDVVKVSGWTKIDRGRSERAAVQLSESARGAR